MVEKRELYLVVYAAKSTEAFSKKFNEIRKEMDGHADGYKAICISVDNQTIEEFLNR